MAEQTGHRKRVKHYDERGHCHELTFSCYRRMPLLTNDVWRSMLNEDEALPKINPLPAEFWNDAE